MQALKHTNSMLLTMSQVAVAVSLLGLDWFRKFSVALLVALQACAGNASASDNCHDADHHGEQQAG